MSEEKSRNQIKKEEMQEKYADVINDLQVKYGGTDDKGWERLIAIARTEYENRKKEAQKLVPEFESDIEFDMEELQKDYTEFLELAEEKARAEGLIGIE